MSLQAFIDDSYREGAEFVLAGHIASADVWAKFSEEWKSLLRYGTLASNGKYHFKMTEMAQTQERLERVPAFYRLIEQYVLVSISCKINVADLARAKQRLWVQNLKIDWGDFENPYFVAFRCLLDTFHNRREVTDKIIPANEKVDFIFDQQSESRAILLAWDGYIATRPADAKPYGALPRFKDDQECLPLQAADLWAWWVREWYEDGTPEKIGKPDFGIFAAGKERPILSISFDEDELTKSLSSIVRGGIEPGRPIYDVRFSMKPK